MAPAKPRGYTLEIKGADGRPICQMNGEPPFRDAPIVEIKIFDNGVADVIIQGMPGAYRSEELTLILKPFGGG